jgi:hypothetical protein
MALVKIDGAEIELPDDMCKTDKGVRDALTPYYPGAANSDVKRETKGSATIITVTKRAGSKGSYAAVFEALERAPEEITPLLLLSPRARRGDVDAALSRSLEDAREVARARAALDAAPSVAAADVPEGF